MNCVEDQRHSANACYKICRNARPLIGRLANLSHAICFPQSMHNTVALTDLKFLINY